MTVAEKTINDSAVTLKIGAYDNGAKNKPTIVFIHGVGACKETFYETGILQAFDQTHRVIALDLPGHGQSTMLDKLDLPGSSYETLGREYYSLPGIIDQVATALKALRVADACLFGWSIGGHIVHGLSIKYPSLVASIVTTGTPSVNYAEPEDLNKSFSEWFVTNIIKDWVNNPRHYPREESEKIIESMGYTECKNSGRDVYIVNALMDADPLLRKYLYSTLSEHVGKKELYGRAFLEENRRVPVCMIEGEDDAGCQFPPLKAHFNTFVQGNHGGSKLFSFEKTGHAVFRVRPKEFIDSVKEFLNKKN